MRFKSTLLSAVFAFTALCASAQDKCASTQVREAQLAANPGLSAKMNEIEAHTQSVLRNRKSTSTLQASVIKIPVVVHVVYNTTQENVSDAQINSQLAVLNRDFRKLNTDVSLTPAEFAGVAADAGIEFVLATVDPNGNPTTGIERRFSKVKSWGTKDDVKFTAKGGLNAWNSSKYLNLWVCNIGKGTLGYAQFPGFPPETDGVVVAFDAFGTMGAAVAPYNKGRTATHEVGHWLNLRHIWGDASCGNDFVADTPTASGPNFYCPAYPTASCGGNNMTMNYMDYTDDACMYMFTAGQKERMRALFVPGGAKASFAGASLAANGQDGNDYATKEELSTFGQVVFDVYPNPATEHSSIQIHLNDATDVTIKICDIQGRVLFSEHLDNVSGKVDHPIDASKLEPGVYMITVSAHEFKAVKRLVVTE